MGQGMPDFCEVQQVKEHCLWHWIYVGVRGPVPISFFTVARGQGRAISGNDMVWERVCQVFGADCTDLSCCCNNRKLTVMSGPRSLINKSWITPLIQGWLPEAVVIRIISNTTLVINSVTQPRFVSSCVCMRGGGPSSYTADQTQSWETKGWQSASRWSERLMLEK